MRNRILIQNCSVIVAKFNPPEIVKEHDLLIENGLIKEIKKNIRLDQSELPDTKLVDGRSKIIIPGIINSHLHSTETFFKGMVDNLPYDLWRLITYPLLSKDKVTPEQIYLRTLLTGIQMLKNGITTAVDDVAFYPYPTMEKLELVMRAYEKLGIRAFVSANLLDVPFYETIPWDIDSIPRELINQLKEIPTLSSHDQLAFVEDCIDRWKEGTVRFILAPSAPQRCTKDFFISIADLSEKYQLPMHVHVLETKTQAVTAQKFYNKTMIAYMDEIGVLLPQTSIVHGIWVTKDDIDLIAKRGSSLIHNPVSNLKLGSGVAPLNDYINAGINIALGCDGTSSNDAQNMFETIKFASLLNKVSDSNFDTWISSSRFIEMSTKGAANTVLFDDSLGELVEGKKADIVLLDANSFSFTPLNNVINQIVYCENGQSVSTVIVDGKIVVHDRKCVNVDEAEIMKEIKDIQHTLLESDEVMKKNLEYFRYVKSMYNTSMKRNVGINRLVSK